MIDNKTVYCLLDHVACEVLDKMRNGRTLEQIDDCNLGVLRKKDRIAVYERMVGWDLGGEEGDAIAAHLRVLKRRKRLPTATVISFRPEDRPTQ
jgi:hypothetical protein